MYEVTNLGELMNFIETINVSEYEDYEWKELDNKFYEVMKNYEKSEIDKTLGYLLDLDIFDVRFDVLTRLPKTMSKIAFK